MTVRLSQGIRIYEHAPDRTRLGRDNFNYAQGMNEWKELLAESGPLIETLAVGCESGAMTVHYKWAY